MFSVSENCCLTEAQERVDADLRVKVIVDLG